MALGVWKIYDPVSNAYETLDKTSEKHQLLLAADEVTLRDEGMSGTGAQSTADLPVWGNYMMHALPVDVVTYTAGTLTPVHSDPSNSAFFAPLAQGAGSPSIAGVVIAAGGASRGTQLRGPLPKGTRWIALSLAGAGTAKLLVTLTKLPALV